MLEEEIVLQRHTTNAAKHGALHEVICITAEPIDDVCKQS